ncbi:MAG: TonB-dependent receptor [Ignavibacteriae bacterium]|nr:TonB-dependent receptor [Ignavibacteriota bacterium]
MQSFNTNLNNFGSLIFRSFLLLIFISSFQLAQRSGNIIGVVNDKASGDPLPGANVFLDGTSFGAASSLDGEYVIRQVPPGDYNMIVKYIGYKEKKIAINVKSGSTLKLDVDLEYVAVESEEVLVSAQAVGQIEAINQQLSSNTIKNVVSADRIQDIPDINAAESVARLPGISIVRSGGEGQKVTVRGLSPKYNVMQVNGVRMQSTDRDDRSVDLNMIAPNVLSGIEVTKALTADMDADAVGGTVNLKIGSADEGFHSRFGAQGGYGSMANTYGNYRINGLISDRFFDEKLGVQVSGFLDNFNRNSDVLSASWITNRSTVTEQGSDLLLTELEYATITDRITNRKRAGGGLVLDYQLPFGKLFLNNFISNLSENQKEVWNGIYTNGAFSAYATLSEASNTVFNNALQGEFEFSNIGMDFSISNSVSSQYRPGDLRMNVGTEQGQTGTIIPQGFIARESEPDVFLNTISVSKNLRVTNFNTLKRDVNESAQEGLLNFKIPYNFSTYLSGTLKFGGKFVHNNRKNDETQWFNTPDRVHVGELFVQLLEDSVWTDLGLAPEDRNLGIRAFLFENANYDVGDFLSGKEGINTFFYLPNTDRMKIFERLAKANTVNDNGIIYSAYPIEEQPSRQYDYDYSRNLSAFYVQTDLNIGRYVTLYPGIRYENFDVDYSAYFTERYGPNTFDFRSTKLNVDTINTINGKNWFPQLHVRIKPLDWLDIRLASTKSIIYPDYRAISPYRYLNTFNNPPTLFIGNPYLKPAISQNYDVYASVYDNKIGLFTAGYFYKEVDNLIVASSFKTKDASTINNMMLLTKTQDTQIDTWINLEQTSFIRGFELDWQTHFWYLPSFLHGIVFNINYTHISSETSYPFQTSKKIGTGPFAKTVFIDSSRAGRMPDQPNDILNATIGYDYSDFSARLSFVFQDNVLISVDRTFDERDAYTDASYRWDFTAIQKLPWVQGLQVYLNVNNISNEPDRRFISVLKKLNSVEYYGMTTDLGVKYEF